jgi:GxxExxY protein
MNRRGAETQRENQITETVIGCAIEIHRTLGPGLLESAYEECLCYELNEARLSFRRQVLLPLNYKAVRLDCGYIMDVVVEDLIVIELKTVERILPIHEAQLITYLKLSGHSVGLLMNFNVALMKSGIRRLVNMFHEISAPPRLRG